MATSSKSTAHPEEGKVRYGRGLFSENGVWVNPQTVRDMAESLHMNPEWVTALFGDDFIDYPDDDEMHALMTFSFLDRINEDIRNRYLPWADEVIGVRPEPMEWGNAEPEPEYQSIASEASTHCVFEDDGNDDKEGSEHGVPMSYAEKSKGLGVQKTWKEEGSLKSVEKDGSPSALAAAAAAAARSSKKDRTPPLKEEPQTPEKAEARPLTPKDGTRKEKKNSDRRPSFQVRKSVGRLSKGKSDISESAAPLGKACFCGAYPIARPVVLRCRHRFCLKHLFALKQRAGTVGGDSSITCPYCGDICEYSISGGYLSIQNFKSSAYTSNYSYGMVVGAPRTTHPSLIVPSSTRRAPEEKVRATNTHLGPYAAKNSCPSRYVPSKETSPMLKLPLVFTPRTPAPPRPTTALLTTTTENLEEMPLGYAALPKGLGGGFSGSGAITHSDRAPSEGDSDTQLEPIPYSQDEDQPSSSSAEEESTRGERIPPHVTEFYKSTRLPMQPRKPSLGNVCFCGASPPEKPVVLRCRHRFCLQHLAELRGRTESLSSNSVACPFCGDCTAYTISNGYSNDVLGGLTKA